MRYLNNKLFVPKKGDVKNEVIWFVRWRRSSEWNVSTIEALLCARATSAYVAAAGQNDVGPPAASGGSVCLSFVYKGAYITSVVPTLQHPHCKDRCYVGAPWPILSPTQIYSKRTALRARAAVSLACSALYSKFLTKICFRYLFIY